MQHVNAAPAWRRAKGHVALAARERHPPLDQSVPAVIFRAGGDVLHYGALNIARSLGRAGVPVFAAVEHRFSPLAASRFCTGSFVLPGRVITERERLAEWLFGLAGRFDSRPVVYAADDEAAIVLAEHAEDLRAHFRLPDIPSHLPALLSTKSSLSALCREHGVGGPRTLVASGRDALDRAVAELGFPLALKNDSPFRRLERPVVGATTIVETREQLRSILAHVEEPFSLVVQEYLPRDCCSDWFSHAYVDHTGRIGPVFTGLKIRSWPPHRGVTTYGVALSNQALLDETLGLLKKIGYRGIVDLDWRRDERHGRFNLLDFNPRTGAQFSLFADCAGLDVVRAMHLDLTDRLFEPSLMAEGDRFVVEHTDLPARYFHRREELPVPLPDAGRVRFAWLAVDDPLPVAVAAGRALEQVTRRIQKGVERRN